MTLRAARVGAAARYLVGFALITGVVLFIVGILAGSAIATVSGFLLVLGVVLLVGVAYSAVFARDAQLARRETSRPR
jgi:hypothetical protein